MIKRRAPFISWVITREEVENPTCEAHELGKEIERILKLRVPFEFTLSASELERVTKP